MTVTEGRMVWGSFHIDLKPDTPASIVAMLNDAWFSLVKVYSSRIPATTLTGYPILYTGLMTDRPNRFAFEGSGPARYLGEAGEVNDETQTGPITLSTIAYNGTSAGNLTQWVTSILTDTGCGLTVGTISGPTGTTYKKGSFLRNTAKTMLDKWVCSKFTVEYRVNPDLSVDVGYPATLYPFTSPYPIATRIGGRDLDGIGLNATQLGLVTSVKDRAQRAICTITQPSTSARTANSSSWPFLNAQGNTLAWSIQQPASNGNTTSLTDAQDDASDDAARIIAEHTDATRSLTLSATEYEISAKVKAGDWIYVFDVDEGLFDVANEMQYRGRTIHPVKLRVEEVTWPLQQGMDIWLDNTHQSGGLTNLTRFVDFSKEPTESVLTVGAVPKTMGRYLRSRR